MASSGGFDRNWHRNEAGHKAALRARQAKIGDFEREKKNPSYDYTRCIKRLCGHRESVTLRMHSGKEYSSFRSNQWEWVASNPCTACEPIYAMNVDLKEHGFPILKGTPAQIKWAVAIRREVQGDMKKLPANSEYLHEKFQALLRGVESAKWWIDNRRKKPKKVWAGTNGNSDFYQYPAAYTEEWLDSVHGSAPISDLAGQFGGLTGSEKEVKWASALRDKAVVIVDNAISDMPEPEKAEMAFYRDHFFRRATSSKWWIDNRFEWPVPGNPQATLTRLKSIAVKGLKVHYTGD